ncbi:MAG: helix-turn-helix domain-containing protein [Myxococcota bacterium]
MPKPVGMTRKADRLRALLDYEQARRGLDDHGSDTRLAKAMGVHQTTVTRIRAGSREPGASVLDKAADAFGVSHEYFHAPGPPDLDPGPYMVRRRHIRSIIPEVEDAIRTVDLSKEQATAMRSISWGGIRPTRDGCLQIAFGLKQCPPKGASRVH